MIVAGHLCDRATTAEKGSRAIQTLIAVDVILLAQLRSGLTHDDCAVDINHQGNRQKNQNHGDDRRTRAFTENIPSGVIPVVHTMVRAVLRISIVPTVDACTIVGAPFEALLILKWQPVGAALANAFTHAHAKLRHEYTIEGKQNDEIDEKDGTENAECVTL
jgi:hypothetical protein